MRTGRAAWLILAADGPATELPDRVQSTVVRVISDPRRFRDVLLAERPRVVVCASRRRARRHSTLVAAERRRRSGMRAVHLAPPDAVEDRLAALAAASTTRSRPRRPRPSWRGGSPGWTAAPDPGPDRRPSSRSVTASCSTSSAHELRRDGQVIHLRPKEFGLLALLAAHPGRAYTRRELLDRRLGPGPRRRTADGRRPRALAALEDRAPSRPARLPGDGPRRRLPARRAPRRAQRATVR